jgi:hypothetical protein
VKNKNNNSLNYLFIIFSEGFCEFKIRESVDLSCIYLHLAFHSSPHHPAFLPPLTNQATIPNISQLNNNIMKTLRTRNMNNESHFPSFPCESESKFKLVEKFQISRENFCFFERYISLHF